MDTLKNSSLKKVFSIPGRVRISIPGLFKNEQKAFNIRNTLFYINGIKDICVNKNTGNILVIYDNDIINEQEIFSIIETHRYNESSIILNNKKFKYLDKTKFLKLVFNTFNPFIYFRYKNLNLYNMENKKGKNLITFGAFISTIVFIMSGSIFKGISILILSNPAFLITLSKICYYFGSNKLQHNNIYLKDNITLKNLEYVNQCYLSEGVSLGKTEELSEYNLHTKQLILRGQIVNPVTKDLRNLVNQIRTLGIKDIVLICSHKVNSAQFAAYYLNIKKINNNVLGDIDPKHSLLIVTEDEIKTLDFRQLPIVVCLYDEINLSTLHGNINLLERNKINIPYIIKLSYFSKEILTQSQNINITMNVLEMFLITTMRLNPIATIMLYGFNTTVTSLFLRKSIYKFKNFNMNYSGYRM